ncbi:MAG: ATP-binding protein [Prevotella sp.]|nr:ATP-binding protein [Prevotella sp.]
MSKGLRHTTKRLFTTLFITIAWVSATMAVGENALGRYSKESPLRIVCDNEFYPFEYRDETGKIEGLDVKVLQKVLDEYNIPYNMNIATRTEMNSLFNSNDADLIARIPINPIPGVYYTKNEVAPYKVMIAYPKGKTPIKKLSDLKQNDIVIFKEGNYCTEYVLANHLIRPEQMMFRTVKQGLLGIATGDYQYMICGEITMNSVMKKFNISNVELSEIDIPEGSIRFCSRDKMLINLIDERLGEMHVGGQLDKMFFQSLSATTVKNNNITYMLFATFGLLLMIIIIILVNRYVTRRIKAGMQSTIETNNILKKALETANMDVLENDINKRWITNLYGNFVGESGTCIEDITPRIHPDEMGILNEKFRKLINREEEGAECTFRYNAGTDDSPNWRTLYANILPELDNYGNVVKQITTINDITEETRQDKIDHETSEIYKHIFDMPIVGLALYDSDGQFIEANQVMRDIFKNVNHNTDIFAYTSIYDFPAFAGIIDRTTKENLFFCTYSDTTNDGMPNFVEIRMRHIKDDNGNIIYRMITARDKSNEREMYRQSRLNDEKVRMVSEQMMQYENELRYLLKGSMMRVWKSSIQNETIRLYRDLHTFDMKYTFAEFLDGIEESKRDEALKLIDPRTNGGKSHNSTLLIYDKQSRTKMWYTINSIPEHDDHGNIIGSFGLIHNINNLMETQLKMQKEKERANDSSRLKSTFLANMSHEIRTPLNAIVGFCDILHTIESPEEKAELLKIIHNNCNNLLQIINDILVLSELDSNGMTINPEKCDFAQEFTLLCKSLEQRVSEPSVKFITENPYSSLMVNIDKGRISQVITNFLTNSVKYTHEGHIKLGYIVKDNGLRIYCEDTGSGIPKDKLEKIFERFFKVNEYIQGAGIGLSICKAIVNKCNGKIGVESEEGKGSTFWIWVPCEIFM